MFKFWGYWVLAVVLTFGIPEAYAMFTVGAPGTLTNFVRTTTKQHVAVIFLLGALVGWAFMHFWGGSWCG